MAYKCRLAPDGATIRDFFLLGRPNEVTETQYGYAEENRIDFPTVSTCTVLAVLLGDNAVVAAHFSVRDTAPMIDAVLGKMNEYRNNRAVSQIYLLGVLNCRSSAGGWKNEPRYAWPEQIGAFNAAFGRPRSALVYGHMQGHDNGQDYRATVGGGQLLWFHKPERSTGWEPQPIGPL